MTTKATATTDIIYPETDGMPLPDGLTQAPIYARILEMLRTFFKDLLDCEVNGDVFIYYIEGDNRRTVSPDCFVVFGLSEAALRSLDVRNTYVMHEVGKPPDFVLEIGSPSTGREDTGRKRDLYAEIGVGGVLALRRHGRRLLWRGACGRAFGGWGVSAFRDAL